MSMSPSEKSTFLASKWKDPTYRGCFTGVTSFTKIVNADFKLGVTKNQVLKALMSIPSFVDCINSKTKPEQRHYDITSAFDTWSMDLAFLKKYRRFIGFLICVDIGSRKIYTRNITTKSSKTQDRLLRSIFTKECQGFSPQKVITDAGTEFKGLKKLFREYGIYHKIATTDVKASIAERYIGIVKERLMKAMDSLRNKNWPKLLPDIVKAINSTENKAIGGLKPSEVETPFDNFKLEEKMEDRKYQQPHWYEQLKNQEKFEGNVKNIQVGDWVLANQPQKKDWKKDSRERYFYFFYSFIK